MFSFHFFMEVQGALALLIQVLCVSTPSIWTSRGLVLNLPKLMTSSCVMLQVLCVAPGNKVFARLYSFSWSSLTHSLMAVLSANVWMFSWGRSLRCTGWRGEGAAGVLLWCWPQCQTWGPPARSTVVCLWGSWRSRLPYWVPLACWARLYSRH